MLLFPSAAAQKWRENINMLFYKALFVISYSDSQVFSARLIILLNRILMRIRLDTDLQRADEALF